MRKDFDRYFRGRVISQSHLDLWLMHFIRVHRLSRQEFAEEFGLKLHELEFVLDYRIEPDKYFVQSLGFEHRGGEYVRL